MTPDEAITILVATSPIASHPSTEIIDATIASVRSWLPEARIVVMTDGIRKEQEEYRERYLAYMHGLISKGGRKFEVHVNSHHLHQNGLMRVTLPWVKTPLILFMEHDAPLVTDRQIDWQGITDALLSGDVGCVRFLPESRVCPYHLYMYEEQFESHGVPLWKTRQWSQRPHVATVELYKKALALFSPDANTMIEDRLATFVMNEPWEAWRVAVYNPPDSMMRSRHLDGRGTDSKFEKEMRF